MRDPQQMSTREIIEEAGRQMGEHGFRRVRTRHPATAGQIPVARRGAGPGPGCSCCLGLLGVASALVILVLVALFVVGMLATARGTASLPIAGLLA